MYVIVTRDEEVLQHANKCGASIFEASQISGLAVRTEHQETEEHKIHQFMMKMAIKPNLAGYDYIKYIMKKCMEDPTYHRNPLFKCVYADCASHFKTEPQRAERAIRHALHTGFKAVPEIYSEMFNEDMKSKPKNGEFISMGSLYLTNSN